MRYVIFSFRETIAESNHEHEPLFWNSWVGWGSLSDATVFTKEEVAWYIMPGDGVAIELP